MVKKNSAMGIVFANAHDELVKELGEQRAMGSVPFGGRYRLIDFTLSNLYNADIDKVGLITKSNYQSLMRHVGSGKSWDLARKNGGLYLLPPYAHSDRGIYHGQVDALGGIRSFLTEAHRDYVVLCDADVVSNIDVKKMLRTHIESGADITIACKKGVAPAGDDVMKFTVSDDSRVTDIELSPEAGSECLFSLDITVISRNLLIKLVDDAMRHSYTSLAADIYQRKLGELDIRAYEVDGYVAVIDSVETYIRANMSLLERDIRRELLCSDRPVLTHVRNEMPVKYGLNADVKNSLIADGCVIEGTVENCVLFRGVKVGKGAVLRNCIVMEGTEIGENCDMQHVCVDKEVTIRDYKTLYGSESYYVYIRKASVV